MKKNLSFVLVCGLCFLGMAVEVRSDVIPPPRHMVAWGPLADTFPSSFFEITDVKQIAANQNSAGGTYNGVLILRTDGTVVSAYGKRLSSQVPPGLNHVVSLAVGMDHALALKSDGHVVAWGDNTNHQCDVPSNLSDVTMVAAGGMASMALKSDGTVVFWGSAIVAQGKKIPVVTPSEFVKIRSISMSYANFYALTQDGTLLTSSGDPSVPTGIMETKSNLTKMLSNSMNWVLGIQANGLPYAYLASGVHPVFPRGSIPVMDMTSDYLLLADGTVKGFYGQSIFGGNVPPPAPPANLRDVSLIGNGGVPCAFGRTEIYLQDNFDRPVSDSTLGSAWDEIAGPNMGFWRVVENSQLYDRPFLTISNNAPAVALVRSTEAKPISNLTLEVEVGNLTEGGFMGMLARQMESNYYYGAMVRQGGKYYAAIFRADSGNLILLKFAEVPGVSSFPMITLTFTLDHASLKLKCGQATIETTDGAYTSGAAGILGQNGSLTKFGVAEQ